MTIICGPDSAADLDRVKRESMEVRTRGRQVTTRAEMSSAGGVIGRIAIQRDADLTVLGAIGQRRGTHRVRSSVADHEARTTPIPLLPVRDTKRLHARGEADLSPVSTSCARR